MGEAKSIGVLRLRDCEERNRFAQDDRLLSLQDDRVLVWMGNVRMGAG